MQTQNQHIEDKILAMLEKGMTRQEIEGTLMNEGMPLQFAKEIIGETISLRNAKRRSKGLNLILAGAIICFVSFLLTITNTFVSDSFGITMYGMTGIGVLIVFYGFTFIF